MFIRAGALLFALLLLLPGAGWAAPQMLLHLPAAAQGAARGNSVMARGAPVRFNTGQMFGLSHRAEVELTLPDGARHPYLFEFAESKPGGITTWVGRHRDKGATHRAIVTQGPAGAFGSFSTPDGEFRLIPGDGHDVLVDMDLESLGIPPIDLRNDALPAPPHAKRLVANGTLPRPFVAIPGVNSVAIAKSTPAPIYEIDLMIVYSRAFGAKLGANLMTRLNFLVARANTTFADSEIAVRLRLVRAHEVDYTENASTLDAIFAITPNCNANECTPPAEPAFRDVEPIRARVGADMVAFLRGTSEFGGDGRGYLGSDPPWPGSLYSVVTGCVLGCDWVFIHELGHNLGVHHDRPTVAQASGGTSTYYGGAYPYSFGYAFCTSGTLSCNPFVPPASGGCAYSPECSSYHPDNFADVMAYFYGTTFRNYRFSNPAIRCAGSSGIEASCGIVSGEMAADGARTINNLRAQIAAIKSTVDPLPPQPTLLGFEHDAYSAVEIATDLVVVVRRQGGTSGTARVSYRTRDGRARAGSDYTAVSGVLTWADGEAVGKTIRIPILPDGAIEGAEQFYVDLFEPSGSGEVYLTAPVTTVVNINEPWPPNNAWPAGFSSPAPDAWTLATDDAYEGQYSLRSARVFGSGSFQGSSTLAFDGRLAGGEIVFAYRASTAGHPRSALMFAINGQVVLEGFGETGWKTFRWPVAAGTYALRWTLYNYDATPCSGNPSAPGGTACADRAWIDAVSLPLAVGLPANLTFTSTPNPSAPGTVVTLTAQLTGEVGTPRGFVAFREGGETLPQCSRVDVSSSGRAVCATSVLGAGTHTITATYLGDATYAGGEEATLVQTVNGTTTPQTITFEAPADRSADSAAFMVQATASSGLPVTFATHSATVCLVTGASVKLRGLGRCTLRANQDGNASYQPAAPVERSFMVTAATGPGADTRAAPTYESAGLYWTEPGASPAPGCEVRFRRVGDSAWTPGLAMWFDEAGNECRGSLVHLAAGTDYEAEIGLPGHMPLRRVAFRTWANQKPVATTIMVPGGSATLNVSQSGSPSGYVVYQGAGGAVLDAGNAAPFNVTINASYVIVRGLTLRGAQQDAIRISPGVTDVVIEDNDISGWGRHRSGTYGVNMDSAIRATCATPTLERVTIQRNRIHDPRYGANSWSEGHPEGPQAITFSHCGGHHVVRHNEISASDGHYYNDIIGGEDNFTTTGFPNHDSDIYGNLLSHAWDDAIEAEGGNRNVRVWGNYIDSTTTGIATALTSVGPFYGFRNVYNRNRELANAPLDADLRQQLFKAGSAAGFPDGRRYFFHNTTLQASQAGANRTLGVAFGISGSGPSQPFNNAVSRNNIFHTWDNAEIVYRQPGVNNEFTRDMYNGVANVPVTNGIHSAPSYAPGNGWSSESGGRYALAAGTPGHDAAVPIANFNDGYLGSGPDVGAAEAGAAPMRFGLAASPGPSVGNAAQADLVLTQSASPNPAMAGRDVVFTLAVTNQGPQAASSVSVTDTLPPGSAFVWASPGCVQASGVLTCSAGTLASGAGARFKLVVRPVAAGSITNSASVSGAQFDSAPSNNGSSLTVGVNALPAGIPVVRYRLYSPGTQEHLFTTDQNEYNVLGASGAWQQEGTAGKVLDNPGSFNGVTAVPYYRLYNKQTFWHHWTTDANEYYTLVEFAHWVGEGVDGYLLPANTTGATQLYRLLYPDGRGLHHWTVDAHEYNTLIATYGWIGEGGSGFVIQ